MAFGDELVECALNVSEGRDQQTIEALREALKGVKETRLLDVASDVDHHRSVFSFVSSPDAISAAVLSVVAEAIARIDLRRHRGVHPRVGAVDVVPLVPVRGTTLERCVELATSLASRIAERFELPVFLYAAAARIEEHRQLASIRRGGLEGLAKRLRRRGPDFGPGRLHPTAGAVAVGARGPLIAFNVYLDDGTEPAIARAVAASIRESDGGLPAVQALGFLISSRRQAQVSMNLLDYNLTRPLEAFRAVDRLARRLGSRASSSELIGLIPEAAITSDEAEEIGLEDFGPERILERSIERALADPG